MEKSVFSKDYRVFLRHLREARENAGLTQEQLADRLGQTQSFVSKCERGEQPREISL
ncbi:MAG TPA: helix-turn-helix transcriptional regulator [Phycisphaerae bacterium]|nr:helix-turn-helix transcriptional regulator [Phycisphaerae bacterium]